MIVNTLRLFIRLLPGLRINAVCDVGSMNGADAMAFRDSLPQSSIFPFGPNPENFRLMQADRALDVRPMCVETAPYISSGQKLYSEVRALAYRPGCGSGCSASRVEYARRVCVVIRP